MPVTRRTQLLIDPEDYRRLRSLARRRKVSIAELVRKAIRTAYLQPQPPDRSALVEAILHMNLPGTSWKGARKEIVAGHAGLS